MRRLPPSAARRRSQGASRALSGPAGGRGVYRYACVSGHLRVAPPFVTVPFLVAASSTPSFGILRVENHSEESGTVEITTVDGAGERFGPVTLGLDTGEVASFTSRQLEEREAQRGLSAGVGDGSGHWRLELKSDLDIAAQAYARNPEDYVSRLDATVASTYSAGVHRYEVAFFNPGSNVVKPSVLRLVNPSGADAEVTVSAVDDDGAAAPDGGVTLTVPAGEAHDLSAQALESGAEDFEGSFGDGEGKWRLAVHSDRVLHVLSLLRSRWGYLATLSR